MNRRRARRRVSENMRRPRQRRAYALLLSRFSLFLYLSAPRERFTKRLLSHISGDSTLVLFRRNVRTRFAHLTTTERLSRTRTHIHKHARARARTLNGERRERAYAPSRTLLVLGTVCCVSRGRIEAEIRRPDHETIFPSAPPEFVKSKRHRRARTTAFRR